MKRLFTATCFAAACMVGLTAQSGSSTTPQDPSQTGGRGGGPVTVTGCLKAGDTAGTYMLTNVTGLPMGRRGGGDTGMGSGMGGGATTTTAGGTTTGGGQGMGGRGMSVMLNPGTEDLSAHVGHKIEVTGTLSGGRRGGAGGAGTTAGGGTGTTTGGGTGSTAGGTGSTAGGTGMAGGQGMGGGRGMRTLTVTSMKHISDDCSGQ